MKRTNSDVLFSLSKKRTIRLLILLLLLCILSVIFDVSFVFKTGFTSVPQQRLFTNSKRVLKSEEISELKDASIRLLDAKTKFAKTHLSGLNLIAAIAASKGEIGVANSANDAVVLGRRLWEELELKERNGTNGGLNGVTSIDHDSVEKQEECPYSITVSGEEVSRKGKVIVLPCGLTLGSHITVVGKPRAAHAETKPQIAVLRKGDSLMVSQFMLELQGLKTVEGEEPPRILHFNPRLKGIGVESLQLSTTLAIECSGGFLNVAKGGGLELMRRLAIRFGLLAVDGFVKCENWIRDDDTRSEESKATWWLNRLVGRNKKVSIDWPFPFQEEKLFVLTLSTGLEGYHVFVDGRHLTSFPYRTGFTLEDATGLFVNGDIDVHSVLAASLPTSHPSFAPKKHLDLSDRWKAPPIPDGPVELFIGVLSAGNHFAERMAVRKSWMQHELIKSSNVVARFFVALHGRKDVNEEVKKEAEFFGDIVIVPYMDSYDLVVLKTVAICEYGVRTVPAKYIMKGDDDTFVRVDAIIDETKKVQSDRSLYIGNINYYHKPLRSGKWEVTLEEWAEEVYPPYANGPGYIISSDIATSILSDFEKHRLRLFKMEDVSMGIWIEKHNKTRPVEYVHSLKFCQFGCVQDYITAHYQSPRQMICLWNKLRREGRPLCCNMR